jgi:hypothetical protein
MFWDYRVLAPPQVCGISATVAKNAAARGPSCPNLVAIGKHWLFH